MLSYAVFAIRLLIRFLGNLRRRLQRAPDYIIFVLEGTYPELRPPRRPFWQRWLSPPQTSLQDLAEQFRIIAGDPRIRGVVLHIRQLNMMPAQLQTLRDLIGELRAAGKRIIAWSPSYYDSASYYVACMADEILLQAGGSIMPLGLRRSYLYLADALERIGLKGDFVQISPYKSAGDVFTKRSMPNEVREMANWLIDADYAELIRGIAAGRRRDETGARAIVDHAPYTDLEATDAGVVDKLVSEEDLPVHLGSQETPTCLSHWEDARKRLLRRPITRPGRYIALLRIEGDIIDGRSGRPPLKPPMRLPLLLNDRAGDLSVVQEARRVLTDKRAAAVVLYIDSGGGSATASEAMAATLGKIAAKKPLVVAMGSVAASGGYYIATPARWIVAQPGTITGSIGVLNGKLVNAGLLAKLLFNRETISRGKHATLLSVERPFSEEEREALWRQIKRTYEVFLNRVATSRKMSREAVDAVGGGRVWTGRQALERGLVDELGGLETALAKARQLADLDDRAPVREIKAGKQPLAPAPASSLALAHYAIQGLQQLGSARALLLCPLIWDDALSNL
jgi:protease-4